MSSKSERCPYTGGIPIKTHFYFAHVHLQYLKTYNSARDNCSFHNRESKLLKGSGCVKVVLAANGCFNTISLKKL